MIALKWRPLLRPSRVTIDRSLRSRRCRLLSCHLLSTVREFSSPTQSTPAQSSDGRFGMMNTENTKFTSKSPLGVVDRDAGVFRPDRLRNGSTLDERLDYVVKHCAFIRRSYNDSLVDPVLLANLDVVVPLLAELAQAGGLYSPNGASNRACDFARCLQTVAEKLQKDFGNTPDEELLSLREAVQEINAKLFVRLVKLDGRQPTPTNAEAIRICLSVAALHQDDHRAAHQCVLPFEVLSVLVSDRLPVGAGAVDALQRWLAALELLRGSPLVDHQNTVAHLPSAIAAQMATAVDGLCSHVDRELTLPPSATVGISGAVVELHAALDFAAPRSTTAPLEAALRRLSLVAVRAACSLAMASASTTTKGDVVRFIDGEVVVSAVEVLLARLNGLAGALATATRRGAVFDSRGGQLRAKSSRSMAGGQSRSDAEPAARKALQRCLAALVPLLREPFFAERAPTDMAPANAAAAARQQLTIDRAWLALLCNVAAVGVEGRSLLPATREALTEDACRTMVRLSRVLQRDWTPTERLEVFVGAVESAAQLQLPVFSTANASVYVRALSKTIKKLCAAPRRGPPPTTMRLVELLLGALSRFEDGPTASAPASPAVESARFEWALLTNGAQQALTARILAEYRPGRASFGQLCRLFQLLGALEVPVGPQVVQPLLVSVMALSAQATVRDSAMLFQGLAKLGLRWSSTPMLQYLLQRAVALDEQAHARSRVCGLAVAAEPEVEGRGAVEWLLAESLVALGVRWPDLTTGARDVLLRALVLQLSDPPTGAATLRVKERLVRRVLHGLEELAVPWSELAQSDDVYAASSVLQRLLEQLLRRPPRAEDASSWQRQATVVATAVANLGGSWRLMDTALQLALEEAWAQPPRRVPTASEVDSLTGMAHTLALLACDSAPLSRQWRALRGDGDEVFDVLLTQLEDDVLFSLGEALLEKLLAVPLSAFARSGDAGAGVRERWRLRVLVFLLFVRHELPVLWRQHSSRAAVSRARLCALRDTCRAAVQLSPQASIAREALQAALHREMEAMQFSSRWSLRPSFMGLASPATLQLVPPGDEAEELEVYTELLPMDVAVVDTKRNRAVAFVEIVPAGLSGASELRRFDVLKERLYARRFPDVPIYRLSLQPSRVDEGPSSTERRFEPASSETAALPDVQGEAAGLMERMVARGVFR